MSDKDRVFFNIARELASLGTCDRAKVGALIVWGGRCVSWGYNGAPPGMPHCSENMHGWLESARFDILLSERDWATRANELADEFGCKNSTHAEANALAFAARQGISTVGSTLYVTLQPCEVCARLLIAAGIAEVKWQQDYRDPRGAELLREANITTRPSAQDCR